MRGLNRLIQYTFVTFLILVFLFNLGPYPLKVTGDFFPNLPYLLIYLVTITAFSTEILLLKKILVKSRFKTIILHFGIILALGIFTFPPRFSISGVDYSYFFGPIREIASGKTIYTEISSQYGFLSILFLTALSRLVFLPISYLPILIWLLLLMQYYICFYLIYRQSGSLIWALIGLLSILTINYFTVRVIPTDYPQSGPLRWLPLITTLFLLSKVKDITSYKVIFCIALLAFWMIDSGIELLLAYLATIFFFWLTKLLPLKKVLSSLFSLFFSLLAIFTMIQIVHLILGYKLIDFPSIFVKIRQYAGSGFGMLPLEFKNYFWLTILFYFASIIYFLKTAFKNKKVGVTSEVTLREADCADFAQSLAAEKGSRVTESTFLQNLTQLLLFSANLMLFASIYFVGRSHPAELYTISIFILLQIFLTLGMIYREIHRTKLKIVILFLTTIFFILFPLYNRTEALVQSFKIRMQRFRSGNILKPEMDEILRKKYEIEIGLIKRELPEKNVLIISGDDTYLLYLTDKNTLLTDNSLVNILTKKDLEKSTAKAKKICPQKIAGECRLFKSCLDSKLFSKAFYAWQPLVLKEIENSCNIKYVQKSCTSQLCIAEAEKL